MYNHLLSKMLHTLFQVVKLVKCFMMILIIVSVFFRVLLLERQIYGDSFADSVKIVIFFLSLPCDYDVIDHFHWLYKTRHVLITSHYIHFYMPWCGFRPCRISLVTFRWYGTPHHHFCGFGFMLSEQLGLTCLLLITWLSSFCSVCGYFWKRYCLHVGEPHKHDFRLWNQGLASF